MGNAACASRTIFGRGDIEEFACKDVGDSSLSDAEELREREDAWEAVLSEATSVDGKPPCDMSEKELGDQGELLAESYLRQRDYEILARKYKNLGGEADIIAREDDCVVFVEVKTRLTSPQDEDIVPELAVTLDKQERYRKIALYYLIDHRESNFVRFDVIAIKIHGERQASLRHLVGAFVCDL